VDTLVITVPVKVIDHIDHDKNYNCYQTSV